MQVVPLSAEPNQSFTVYLDSTRYAFRVFAAPGVMCVDLDIDGESVLRGSRLLAGEMVIPYPAQQVGNFVMLTDGDALPDWSAFGVSQTLVYLSPDELAAL